ncbi:uncharacterized protein TNCV_4317281 [Trichonephila clavipes]|nr:uncharacterized protein TNCV_4317281 [Trichonephila clavipes]
MWRHCMKDRGRVIGQVDSNQENSKDLGKPRVSRITVINQGFERRDQKRSTSEPKQGIKRAIQSSVSSRQVTYSSEQARRSGQYNKARETKTTKNVTNWAAERRTVRSNQMTAVRPCPYYLRSRVRQPEGFPEERRNSGIASIPQNSIRRRSLSMEALDGDPVDRSE